MATDSEDARLAAGLDDADEDTVVDATEHVASAVASAMASPLFGSIAGAEASARSAAAAFEGFHSVSGALTSAHGGAAVRGRDGGSGTPLVSMFALTGTELRLPLLVKQPSDGQRYDAWLPTCSLLDVAVCVQEALRAELASPSGAAIVDAARRGGGAPAHSLRNRRGDMDSDDDDDGDLLLGLRGTSTAGWSHAATSGGSRLAFGGGGGGDADGGGGTFAGRSARGGGALDSARVQAMPSRYGSPLVTSCCLEARELDECGGTALSDGAPVLTATSRSRIAQASSIAAVSLAADGDAGAADLALPGSPSHAAMALCVAGAGAADMHGGGPCAIPTCSTLRGTSAPSTEPRHSMELVGDSDVDRDGDGDGCVSPATLAAVPADAGIAAILDDAARYGGGAESAPIGRGAGVTAAAAGGVERQAWGMWRPTWRAAAAAAVGARGDDVGGTAVGSGMLGGERDDDGL